MTSSLRAKLQKRLGALTVRKSKIERLIQQELAKSMPCWLTLQQLKRLRLRLKDHLASLQQVGLADRSTSRF
ncbi:MAG: DUF465 domain-containing protein [Hyphomicrobiaceae bacterium]